MLCACENSDRMSHPLLLPPLSFTTGSATAAQAYLFIRAWWWIAGGLAFLPLSLVLVVLSKGAGKLQRHDPRLA
jgi:hypothetical protein